MIVGRRESRKSKMAALVSRPVPCFFKLTLTILLVLLIVHKHSMNKPTGLSKNALRARLPDRSQSLQDIQREPMLGMSHFLRRSLKSQTCVKPQSILHALLLLAKDIQSNPSWKRSEVMIIHSIDYI